MTKEQKINDLIDKTEDILDELDDVKSNLTSFKKHLNKSLKSTDSSNEWLKNEIVAAISWVNDWQENDKLFKQSLKEIKEYLYEILDEVDAWTSSELTTELNSTVRRYKYLKRWISLVAEYEELMTEGIETDTDDNVDEVNKLTTEADQIYENFYDNSDDFWEEDEDVKEENEEEQELEQEQVVEPKQEINKVEEEPCRQAEERRLKEEQHRRYRQEEAAKAQLNKFISAAREFLDNSSQLKNQLLRHNEFIVNSYNNIVQWSNQYSYNFSEWLYEEVNKSIGWIEYFMSYEKKFLHLFDEVEEEAKDWLEHPEKHNFQWVSDSIQKTYKRYEYIYKWISLTEQYIEIDSGLLRDENDQYVGRLFEIANSIEILANNYDDNSDGYWKE